MDKQAVAQKEFSTSEDDEDISYHDTDDSSGSEQFSTSEYECSGDEKEQIFNVEIGHFILICEGEGRGKKKLYSVGQISEIMENEIKVHYLKRLVPYYKFTETNQFYSFEKANIIEVLPSPNHAATKRNSTIITFETNLQKFNLGLV